MPLNKSAKSLMEILKKICGVSFMARETLSSIPGIVIPKTLKMVLDATLLNTQQYKVRIKVKVEQTMEWSSALLYTLVW